MQTTQTIHAPKLASVRNLNLSEARKKHIASYRATLSRGFWEISTTFAFWVVLFSLFDFLPKPIFVLFHTTLVTRLFVVNHDAGHDSLTPSKTINIVVRWITGTMILNPVGWWKDHRLHHAYNGNLDADFPWNGTILMTKQQLQSLKPGVLRFFYKLLRHPLVYLPMVGIWEFIRFRLPFQFDEYGGLFFWDNLISDILSGLYLYGLYLFRGTEMLWTVGIAYSLSFMISFIVFHAEHAFEGSYAVRGSQWNVEDSSFKGSSFIDFPWFMEWQAMGIGYHHIHHFDTRVPGYLLRKCHEEGDPQFWKETKRMNLFQVLKTFLYTTAFDEVEGKFYSEYL